MKERKPPAGRNSPHVFLLQWRLNLDELCNCRWSERHKETVQYPFRVLVEAAFDLVLSTESYSRSACQGLLVTYGTLRLITEFRRTNHWFPC